MMEALVVVLVIAVVALVAMVVRRPAGAGSESEALRNDVNILRETNTKSIELIAKQVREISGNVQTSLEAVRSDVANRLEANASTVTQASKAMGDHMATAQAAFASLQEQVGGMSEQARQLGEFSKSVTELQRILSSPKLRGGLGEEALESMLGEVFARHQYDIQFTFKSGERADAVLNFPQGKVVIDSKFPLENFRRLAQAATEAEKKATRRDFLKDVRKHIDGIAEKYILPEEGTLPLALAYIPAENVYYEAIIRDEEGNDLYRHCLERRVVPVSPNSLYAYLQTIVMGLNGMRISERAESILRDLESLRVEVDKFADEYATVGKHLRNATAKYDDSARQLDRVESRVRGLADHRGEQLPLLDGEEPQPELLSGERRAER